MPNSELSNPRTKAAYEMPGMYVPQDFHASAAEASERRHKWIEAQHHPIIEAVSHISSPLTAALFIFGVHKAWQLPTLRSHFLSRRILRKHAKTVAGSAAAPSGARQFSTALRAPLSRVSPAQPLRASAWVRTVPAAPRSSARAFSASSFLASAGSRTAVAASSSAGATGRSLLSGFGNFLRGVELRATSTVTHTMDRVRTWTEEKRTQWAMAQLGVSPALAAAVVGTPTASPEAAAAAADLAASAAADLASSQHHRVHKISHLYDPDDIPYVIDHIADLWTVQKAEQALYYIHDVMGLPWWATIASLTLFLRFLILPVNVRLLRNSLRMKIVMPEVERLDKVMKTGTEQEKVKAAEDLQRLFLERNCHPTRNTVIPFVFPPLFLSIFAAIHNVSIAEPTMANEGALWFHDLIAPDPTFLLPVLSAVTWLWVVEAGAGHYYYAWPQTRAVARAAAFAFIPITTTLPAGIFMFWLTSNSFALLRTYVLRNDAVRRALDIPLASEINKLSHLPKHGFK